MKKYNIDYESERYPDLIIQCVHDTHHDFFENPEPMKIEIQGGGGEEASRRE